MPFSTSTPAQPEQVSQPVRIPPPTAAQQLVLDRIEQQRERLRARRAAHDRPLAVAESHAGAGADESLVLRTAWFVREHPSAAAAMGVLAGAGQMIAWYWVWFGWGGGTLGPGPRWCCWPPWPGRAGSFAGRGCCCRCWCASNADSVAQSSVHFVGAAGRAFVPSAPRLRVHERFGNAMTGPQPPMALIARAACTTSAGPS